MRYWVGITCSRLCGLFTSGNYLHRYERYYSSALNPTLILNMIFPSSLIEGLLITSRACLYPYPQNIENKLWHSRSLRRLAWQCWSTLMFMFYHQCPRLDNLPMILWNCGYVKPLDLLRYTVNLSPWAAAMTWCFRTCSSFMATLRVNRTPGWVRFRQLLVFL